MTEEQFNSAVEAQLRPDRARIAELERDRADLLVLAKSLVMVGGDKFSPQSLRIFNEIEARILSEKRHTMSDTPRTDKWEREQECNFDFPWEDHCRTLERENVALREDSARLDWLLQDTVLRFDNTFHDRAEIDAAMKGTP